MLHIGLFCSVLSFNFICLVCVRLFSGKEFMFAPTPRSLVVVPSTESCYLTGMMLLLDVTKYILCPKLTVFEGGTEIWMFVVTTSNKEKP